MYKYIKKFRLFLEFSCRFYWKIERSLRARLLFEWFSGVGLVPASLVPVLIPDRLDFAGCLYSSENVHTSRDLIWKNSVDDSNSLSKVLDF